MMKTLVFDLPAISGGAKTILDNYYNEFKKKEDCEYVFVLGNYSLPETKNIRIVRYPWIKKSVFHRLFFELFIARKIIKSYKPNKILSLQNTYIMGSKGIFQTIYMHQAIPFCDVRFNMFKDTKLWFKQAVLGKYIIASLKKCDEIIVQTKWIKEACKKKCSLDDNKIVIKPIAISFECNQQNITNDLIFYPANSNSYKNHIIILKALKTFKEKHGFCPKTIFTIEKDQNKISKRIASYVGKNTLNVTFVGMISKEKMIEYYQHSILVFPSYLETFGLPLAEAKTMNCQIIASDMPFSHEVLDGYDKVHYFQYRDAGKLYELFEDYFAKEV